jgi:hypothetical protein
MRDRILMAAAFVMTVGPALAGDSIRVPEPATIAIFGAALVGAYVVQKFKGRKYDARPISGRLLPRFPANSYRGGWYERSHSYGGCVRYDGWAGSGRRYPGP